ncbi:MAG: DUF1036 domain-containing protein [Rhizomicrobium sp.]|jgi:uncharacterized membrane protein
MNALVRLGAAISAVAGALLLAAPAKADMHVCNQTSYILYTAIGFKAGNGIETRGWTRIAPGDCALAIRELLTQPVYFIYAKSSLAHSGPARAWGGQYRLCTKNTDFAIQTPTGAPSCGGDDLFLMPFAAVATRGHSSWTATFTESPQTNTFYAAQQAGLARLLADIGFKGNLGEGKALEEALAQLRARLRVPANASPDELFDALEVEAMKASAPSGYSICNDADSVVWAAIGMQQGIDTVARGWWKISPGSCAKAITEPLASDRVLLLAEKHGNDHLVSGPTRLCVTNIEFEIYGGQKCATRGLIEAGFAVTNTKGLSGFVAHIGPNGLLPPARQVTQARTPK